jgi:hypothetical protein
MKKVLVFIFIISLVFLTTNCSNDNQNSYHHRRHFSAELNTPRQSGLDIFFKYSKEALTIVGLALGIYFGLPFLRKKLVEDHVKKLFENIQETNKEIKELTHTLIDKHLSKTYKNNPTSINEIQELYNDLDDLYKKSLNGSSEVVTFSFFLKRTIQGVLRTYEPKFNEIITTSELYELCINVLYEIAFFTTKVITIPYNSKTEQFKYIHPELEQYVLNKKYQKFKHLEQGVDNKYASPLLISFYNHINRCSSKHIIRSAYLIAQSPVPMARLLFLNKIYFPPILKSTEKKLFITDMRLHLISFKIAFQIGSSGQREIVTLLYTNISDQFHFTKSIKKEELETKFFDDYIKSIDIDIKKSLKITFDNLEIITLEFDKIYLEDLFRKNQNRLKVKMKKELKSK